MLCVGFWPLRGALRRARRRRAWGIFPGDPGVVLDIFNAVSTPHISLQARLRSQNILHIFCTLSARNGKAKATGLLPDISQMTADQRAALRAALDAADDEGE